MIRGSRGRIAFIWPDDGLNDDEFWAYLPEGVAWLATRFPGTLEGHALDRATFEAAAELGPMTAAARMMRVARPDVVALGDHAGSFIGGPGSDLRQARTLAEAAGARHGTTPSTAQVEALRHLGARRLSITSPYDHEVTAAGIAFLEAHGFEIVAVERATFSDETGIAGQGPEFWHAAALRADRPGSDTIALLGGGIRTAGILSRLEAATGKPAVPATAALVWHACRLIGVSPDRPGLGRLFSAKPDAGATERLHLALRRRLSSGTKSFAVSELPPLFVSGAGSSLVDTDGRRYLDFACGSGTTVLGHDHPAVMTAIRAQIDRGITHLGPHFHAPVQIALLERLAEVLPPELSSVHPATNGTEAVEVAIKAAIHATGRRRFVAFEGSYHGRTAGALSVSHARGANAALGAGWPETVHLPYPTTPQALDAMRARLEAELSRSDVAAIVVEPVQATAGMRVPDAGFLAILGEAGRRHGSVLIVDEVFTGYGRSGRLFAFERAGVVPDLLVLAKAAGGGMPGAMVAGRPELLQTWRPGVQSSTFQLHPVSAAASFAVLEELVRQKLWERASAIGARIRAALKAATTGLPRVGAVHGIGAMLGVAITDASGAPDQLLTKAIRARALRNGLLTWECGTGGNVIGLVPPLTASDAEVDRAIGLLADAIRQAR